MTLGGAGFDSGAQACIPAVAATTWVSATQLTAIVPAEITGPAGSATVVNVVVQNSDGSVSAGLPFTVVFPAVNLQTWTTLDAVCGEVPGFARGGSVADSQIATWIQTVAQSIAAVMLRRGLSLNPADWQQPDGTATPSPAALLEMINRLGAAARLAGAIAAQFTTGEWGVARALQKEYDAEVMTLREGEYDKIFRPAAATVESGPLLGASGPSRGGSAFGKEQVF